MNAMRFLQRHSTLLRLRLLLGVIFLAAAVPKIHAPALFADAILNYRLLPVPLVNLAALVIPWTEAVAGLFLLAGFWVRAGALVITGLTTGFLVAILSALARGLNIECGCFGTMAGSHVGLLHLALDVTLLALATGIVAGPQQSH
jgi:putative oxidoreductase